MYAHIIFFTSLSDICTDYIGPPIIRHINNNNTTFGGQTKTKFMNVKGFYMLLYSIALQIFFHFHILRHAQGFGYGLDEAKEPQLDGLSVEMMLTRWSFCMEFLLK